MKIVVAPDSMKGSLSAAAFARVIGEAALRHFPDAQLALMPIADGGEGTVEAVVTALGGDYREVEVEGPYGQGVLARYGLIDGGRAVVLELAQASGITLSERRDPLAASTLGTGQMMLRALDAGADRLLIGLGGSATNDGGMGLLHALGVRFYGAGGEVLRPSGAALERIDRVDLAGIDRRIFDVEIRVICDVENPLLGPEGATAVYGPQKGVTPELFERLEAGMRNYARVLEDALFRDVASFPGAGAAGGVGCALKGVLGAQIDRGIDVILDLIEFDRALEGAALAVTGEGRFDGQSVRFHKAPVGVAKRCAKRDVPVLILTGGVGDGYQGIYQIATASVQALTGGPMPLTEAVARAEELAMDAADRLFRTLKIGMALGR